MPEHPSPDFVEALARGLAIITAFSPTATALSVSDAAARVSLPRPTARRLLMTLEKLGYVRSSNGLYTLTTKVLELGTAYVATLGIWELARPHLEALVARTGESSSMSQLDGSDIVYVARVPVPKIIALSVHIGTRFPAVATSMGQVLLADLPRDELSAVLQTPSQSGIIPRITPSRRALDRDLAQVRKRGPGDLRRAPVARHPVGRGARPRRLGDNGRRGQRHGPRGRDARRRAHAPPPAAVAGHGRRHHPRVGQPGAPAGAGPAGVHVDHLRTGTSSGHAAAIISQCRSAITPASSGTRLRNGEWSLSSSAAVPTSAARSRWASGRTARSSPHTTYELGTDVQAGSAIGSLGTSLRIGRSRAAANRARVVLVRWNRNRPAAGDRRTTPSAPRTMQARKPGEPHRGVAAAGDSPGSGRRPATKVRWAAP